MTTRRKYKPRFKNILSTARLGYSSSGAVADAIAQALRREEERTSQHGPVRVIMKAGKMVMSQ